METGTHCLKCGHPLQGVSGHCAQCLLDVALLAPEGGSAGGIEDAEERFPQPFGEYVLEARIGRGGMGVVYRARQLRLNRVVAIKMLLRGGFSGGDALRRFRAEAEATARLRHPNLVTLFEVGEFDGMPFFSMEHVEGRDLADWIQEQSIAPRQAATWLQAAAQAVEHAHQHGVLHRDIKPSNIIIDPFDQPRVTDFGLALQSGSDARLTITGQAVGSPSYMPPEQARGSHEETGPHSDVYSLGAVLYHMLTSRPPFVGDSVPSVLHQVAMVDPVPPRRLNPNVPADLETICLKCLEKSPGRRYRRASDLVQELGRFLNGEPVEARPAGVLERAWKWCLRSPVVAGLLFALSATLSLGIAGVFSQWRRAEEERRAALRNEFRALQNEYAADMRAASEAVERGDIAEGRRLLLRHAPGAHGGTTPYDLRGVEWWLLRNRAEGQELAQFTNHTSTVCSVAVAPGGTRFASAGMDRSLWIGSIDGFLPERRIPTDAVGWFTAFTRDGQGVLSPLSNNVVALFDVTTGRVMRTWPGRLGAVAVLKPHVVLSTASPWPFDPPGDVRIWNYESGERVGDVPFKGRRVAISSDGRRVVVAVSSTEILIWDALEQREEFRLAIPSPVWGLRLSADDRYLAAAMTDRQIRLWDLNGPGVEPLTAVSDRNVPLQQWETPGRASHLLDEGHSLRAWSVVFAPDGKSLLSTSSDRSARLWTVPGLAPLRIFLGHHDEIWCSAFLPDGDRFITGGKDARVMLWQHQAPTAGAEVPNLESMQPAFSPDGRYLISNLATNGTNVASVVGLDGRVEAGWAGYPIFGVFTPDGSGLQSWPLNDGTVRIRPRAALEEERAVRLQGWVDGARVDAHGRGFSTDGRLVYAITSRRRYHVWDTASGRLLHEGPTSRHPLVCAELSLRGRSLALSQSFPYSVYLYDVAAGTERELVGHTEYVKGMAFSPDETILATAGVDGRIRLWDTATGAMRGMLIGHLQEASGVAFSHDGLTLASVESTASVKLWRMDSMREVASMQIPRVHMFVRFSPGDQSLAVQLAGGSIMLFRAPRSLPVR